MFNRSNMLKTMKTTPIKSKSVAKGAPSGFVISLLVHAAAFMLAGLLVVFKKGVSACICAIIFI